MYGGNRFSQDVKYLRNEYCGYLNINGIVDW